MDIDYKAIGQRIRQARVKRNYTQDYIAECTGLSNPHISNIETGNTKLSLPTIIKIANVLSVTVDELLCDNVIKSEFVFTKEIANVLTDCNENEIYLISELAKAAKSALRRNNSKPTF